VSKAETLRALRLTVGAARLARAGRRTWRMSRTGLHLLVGLLAALLPRGPRRVAMRWWVHRLAHILRLHVHVRGPRPTRATLLVTNHISWLDIPALLSVVDADFVAKHDISRWPAIGMLAARVGTIFLRRGARDAAKTTADQMTARLAQRRSVIFFPEATTSDGRGVRKFYARLYQAGIRAYARVQAVAIRYPRLDGPHGVAPFIDDDELLGHMWRLLGEPHIDVELRFCAPLLPDADRRTLATRTRTQICAALDISPALAGPRSAKFRFRRQPRRHQSDTAALASLSPPDSVVVLRRAQHERI
jgi:1-acyl-sn-glycerol-3-phosphate acyltransferase